MQLIFIKKFFRIDLEENFKKHKLARILAQKSGQLLANQQFQQKYEQNQQVNFFFADKNKYN